MNSYIYHVLEGYITIDTGYEHSLKNVERRADKQGITLSEIKYVFLTHAHNDHAGFLNELLSKYSDIKVIIRELLSKVNLSKQILPVQKSNFPHR